MYLIFTWSTIGQNAPPFYCKWSFDSEHVTAQLYIVCLPRSSRENLFLLEAMSFLTYAEGCFHGDGRPSLRWMFHIGKMKFLRDPDFIIHPKDWDCLALE